MTDKRKHILIVEDDVSIARLIELHLQHAGYATMQCDNGLDAQGLMQEHSYDAVVLDRMLPGKRGLDVLRWMRGNESVAKMPVLMVTALAMPDERVRGLNEGADDYLGKPFEPDELVARVAALLRRASSGEAVNFDESKIKLNAETMEVKIDQQLLMLRPLEFKLLQTMMGKPNRVFSREQLLDLVWGMDSFVEERTVDATVKRLRKELESFEQGACIQTIRGVGYRYQVVK